MILEFITGSNFEIWELVGFIVQQMGFLNSHWVLSCKLSLVMSRHVRSELDSALKSNSQVTFAAYKHGWHRIQFSALNVHNQSLSY